MGDKVSKSKKTEQFSRYSKQQSQSIGAFLSITWAALHSYKKDIINLAILVIISLLMIIGSLQLPRLFPDMVPHEGSTVAYHAFTEQVKPLNIATPQSAMWTALLLSFAATVFIIVVVLWLFSRAGQGWSTGSVQQRERTVPEVTFADVAGIDEVCTELSEIVQFLQNPRRFELLGARLPRGALLVGPPGTGKTLIARAIAGEADVPFFSASASEFVEMFVGMGARRIRDLFSRARLAAPSVIFIDEIDTVGHTRSSLRTEGDQEYDQTLNQLLVELDGFDSRQAVIVLAATNRPDVLDAALLRPGRFDRHITVPLPDRVGREAILLVHTRSMPLHEEVNLTRLAAMTTGMAGADLAHLANEAALVAARHDKNSIDHQCFEAALTRIQLGVRRPLVLTEQERRITAIHECGHALVAYYLPEADTVSRITILPHGPSLGATQFTSEVERYSYDRSTLMARLAVSLAGRVAEEIALGPDHVTTGAENDLRYATNLAWGMVTRWGMSEQVGVIFTDNSASSDYALALGRTVTDAALSPALSIGTCGHLGMNEVTTLHQQSIGGASSVSRGMRGLKMNDLIDSSVQSILNQGKATACAILTEHFTQLMVLVEVLLKHEQLDREQFEILLATPNGCITTAKTPWELSSHL